MRDLILLLIGTFLILSFCTRKDDNNKQSKFLIKRITELWNTGNLEIADKIFSNDFINHDPNAPDVNNLKDYKRFIVMIRASFPDFSTKTEDIITEGDKAVIRWTARGTHQGEFFGISPTDKQVTWTGITIYRFADGKVVEAWWSKDILGLLQQLDVIARKGRDEFTWGESMDLESTEQISSEKSKILFGKVLSYFNTGDFTDVDEVFSEDFKNHDPTSQYVYNLETYKQFIDKVRSIWPNFHFSKEDMIAEGDNLAVRYLVKGTHNVSGKEMVWTGMIIFRFSEGKIVEAWWCKDMLGIWQQLGIIPEYAM